jgi:hypothetical protein
MKGGLSRIFGVVLIGAAVAIPLHASAEPSAMRETCGTRAAQCEATCAARPRMRPYTSPYDRCSESCEPRWQQCLRTGLWVHLEDSYPGWRERVARF